ncbi:hypothetical protein H5A44_18520 [Pectobacterium brasiliense]|nr:hypothetical protein [Pectobacterium brasiliense]
MADERAVWETEKQIGCRAGAIVTLLERKNLIYLTKKIFSKGSAEGSYAIIIMLSDYKNVCHTITFDNGWEFSDHKAIAEALEALHSLI